MSSFGSVSPSPSRLSSGVSPLSFYTTPPPDAPAPTSLSSSSRQRSSRSTSSFSPVTCLAERVWAIPAIRQVIHAAMEIDELIKFQSVCKASWRETLPRVWYDIDMWDYLRLETLCTPRERREAYISAVRGLYIDRCLPLCHRFEGPDHLFYTFPNLTRIVGPGYELIWPRRRVGQIPNVVLTIDHTFYLPELTLPAFIKKVASTLPSHWKVAVSFNAHIYHTQYAENHVRAESLVLKEDKKLAERVRGLQQDLKIDIPHLLITAPLTLRTVAAYHRARKRSGCPQTRKYTLVLNSYTLDELDIFAESTRGSIDELDLRPHDKLEAKISVFDLLCRFDWGRFRGIKRVSIAVSPPIMTFPPTTSKVKGKRPSSTFPAVSVPSDLTLNPISAPLDLESLTIVYHWNVDLPIQVGELYYTPQDLTRALLPIGGRSCEYALALCNAGSSLESDEDMSTLMTKMLRLEVERELHRVDASSAEITVVLPSVSPSIASDGVVIKKERKSTPECMVMEINGVGFGTATNAIGR